MKILLILQKLLDYEWVILYPTRTKMREKIIICYPIYQEETAKITRMKTLSKLIFTEISSYSGT